MQTFVQGRRKNLNAGEPIHMPWRSLKQAGALVRRGQLTLIVASAGTGKSLFAHSLVQRGDDNGNVNNTFYVSSDSDSSVMFKRSAAIATGYAVSDIDRLIEDDNAEGLEAAVANATGHIRLDFRAQVTDQDLLDDLDAYAEVWGRRPEVLVVDNLSNLAAGGGEDDFSSLQENCFFLQELAREMNCAVIATHHTNAAHEATGQPVPLSGVKDRLSKTPEVIFTLFRSGESLGVSPVKNRNGVANADGSNPIMLHADLSRMRLG